MFGFKDIASNFISYMREKNTVKIIIEIFMACFFLMWMALVGITVYNWSTIVEIYNYYIQSETVDVEKTVQRTREINTVISHTMHELGADRIHVSTFHNGQVDLRGVHFVFSSRINEVSRPGVSREMNNTQNIPLSFFPNQIDRLVDGKCFVGTDAGDIEESSGYYNDMGIKSIIMCPLQDSQGRLIGMVGVDFVQEYINTEQVDKKLSILRTISERLGGMLSIKD